MPNNDSQTSASKNEDNKDKTTDKPLITDIIVLCAGTVDPSNSDNIGRASSYQGKIDSNWYWKDNVEFRNGLSDFKNKYVNCHIFEDHAWSGDNSVHNRKVAGAYLADRLCGVTGKNSYNDNPIAYYQRFLKKEKYPEVNFHLIGHSHGGNVINEFTKRIAKSPGWPDHWKIKSITYLSTPFFKKLHKPDTSKFHPDCKIINVFNNYDLTQRAIADFSLKQLPGQFKIAAGDKFIELICEIIGHWEVMVPLFIGELNLNDEEGRILYDECIDLLDVVTELITEAKKIIGDLSVEHEYTVATALKGKVTHKRSIISTGLKDRFDQFFLELQRDFVELNIQNLRDTINENNGYSRLGFLRDFNYRDATAVIVKWFKISPVTLESKFFDMVYEAIKEQLDEYDNTRNTPDELYKGVPIIPVDVTEHDDYYQQRDEQFNEFIKLLEEKEDNYESNKTKRNLLDILFTLLAQIPVVRTKGCSYLRIVASVVNGVVKLDEDDVKGSWHHPGDDWKLDFWDHEERANAISLVELCRNYCRILASRNGGFCCDIDDDADECAQRADKSGIEIIPPPALNAQNDPNKDCLARFGTKNAKKKVNRGSLHYLMNNSHNLSRRKWYEEYETKLKSQIGCLLKSEDK